MASGSGFKALVQLPLEAGADVNAQSGTYNTALQKACGIGNKAIVKLLLEAEQTLMHKVDKMATRYM